MKPERSKVMANKFVLHSEYKPTGDQPAAIEKLSAGILSGMKNLNILDSNVTIKSSLNDENKKEIINLANELIK